VLGVEHPGGGTCLGLVVAVVIRVLRVGARRG
jgi:hypothetical protein